MKFSPKSVISIIVFSILAIMILGISCYHQDHETVKGNAKVTSLSNKQFMNDYNHKHIKQLYLNPKNNHINVNGTLKNGQSIKSVTSKKQLGYLGK